MPGDGETSLDEFDEEDDGIDGLEDDCVDPSDLGILQLLVCNITHIVVIFRETFVVLVWYF